MHRLNNNLQQRETDGLYRRRRVVDGAQGPELVVDDKPLLAFCSNDYLGLAADPRLQEAVTSSLRQYGVGSGAAHLISGHSRAHHQLEEELAEFTGRDRALLFSTGYMANTGVLSALLGRSDTVYEDRLNHASLIDGGILSRARMRRYKHADCAQLSAQLTDDVANASGRRRLVATDGVFSMDGDIAPLTALADVCAQSDAWLMVDDAHGLGVLGEQGQGSVSAAGLDQQQVPVYMGTLGKALGTAGAFVAGSEELIETLIQQARSYVYTTAMPAAMAEATRASVRIAREENWRREHLIDLRHVLRQGVADIGLQLMDSDTPIQPIVLGDANEALAWSQALEERGIWVSAIRPPTVPQGSARLRVTLSAVHTHRHVERLLDALQAIARERGQ